MHSRTPGQIGRNVQLFHVPVFLLFVATVGFVHFYFGSGRLWLGLSACLVRFFALLLNFGLPPNLNYREITFLRQLDFLGETVAMPAGIASSWTRLGQLSSLLLLAYVIDASLILWRRGNPENQRRAALVWSITVFILLAAGLAALLHARVLDIPFLVNLPFLGVVLAMGFELSYDLLRAAQTAGQFRASEPLTGKRDAVSLAASAANLGLWVWDVKDDHIWMMEKRGALRLREIRTNRSKPLFAGGARGRSRKPAARAPGFTS